MTDLVILADGGGKIGFGHLMRCNAIKNAWSEGTARLLAQMEGGERAPDGSESFDWFQKVESLKQYVTINTVLLVDSYRPDSDYFQMLKNIFPYVAVLDDYNRIIYPVDLVICPGVYGSEVDYSNQLARTVGGADYVVLRSEILAIKKVEIRKQLETVLITLGGSQQNELLFQQMNDLLEEAGYQVVVVTGNEQVARRISSRNSQVFGKLNTVKMAKIMASVDAAISASGQTLNELAWLGVPTIAIKTGEDQNGNWEYYNRHKLSLAAVLPNTYNLESTIVEVLKKETFDNRVERSEKLEKLLTDMGAMNICSLIKKEGKL